MRQIGSCPCHFPDAWLFTYWQLYLLSAVMVGLLPATSSWSQQEALNRCGRHRHGASLRGTRYPCFHPWNCYNPCLVKALPPGCLIVQRLIYLLPVVSRDCRMNAKIQTENIKHRLIIGLRIRDWDSPTSGGCNDSGSAKN